MATVINDFTIEPKAAPPAANAQSAKEGGGAKEEPKEDATKTLRRVKERALRVWAH